MSTEEILKEELVQLREDIIEASRRAGQEASGETYKQIAAEDVSAKGGKLVGPAYIEVLVRGRKPGKIPYNFADIIKEWAEHKGISFSDEKEFDRWANAVVWKIRREGTSMWQDMGSMGLEADIFYTPIRNFMERLSGRISSAYKIEIIKQINNIWQ